MALRRTRLLQKSSIATLKSAVSRSSSSSASKSATYSVASSTVPSKYVPSVVRRFSLLRSPVELGGVVSMLPLHSVVAQATMTSCLSSSSRSCRALSQGTLCCTSPDLYNTARESSSSSPVQQAYDIQLMQNIYLNSHTTIKLLHLLCNRNSELEEVVLEESHLQSLASCRLKQGLRSIPSSGVTTLEL